MPHTSPRVLFLGLNFPPERTGVAPYTGAMTAGLARRGYNVRTITTHPHYPAWQIEAGYGQWTRSDTHGGVVSVTRLRHYVPRRPRGVARLVSELTFGLRATLIRWERPDAFVAVSPALFATALCMLRARVTAPRIPFVIWVQDLYTKGIEETGQGRGAVSRLTGAIEGWVLRKADRVVVIHDRFARSIQQDFGVDEQNVSVVRNWTHLSLELPTSRAAARARFDWADDEIVILHAGNMGVKQGLDNVVSSARLADARGAKVRFVLLGDGGERERLERVGRDVRRLQFLDSLDDEGFAMALYGADVLLVNEMPGVAEMALPSKLTSYLWAGRPILAASGHGGITADEVLAAGAGIVTPGGDPATLLDEAIALGSNLARADAMGDRGRRYREEVLGEGRALENFAGVLESAMHSRAATRRKDRGHTGIL